MFNSKDLRLNLLKTVFIIILLFSFKTSLLVALNEEEPSASIKENKKNNSFLKALEKKPKLDVNAQLAGLWRMGDREDRPQNEFRVNRARLKLTWKQGRAIEGVVKVETREVFFGSGADSLLRDLYVKVSPYSFIGLRIGQFKKPFSRFSLQSWMNSGLIDRGIGDDYISDHLLFGERDIGLMLEGRLVKSIKLDYALGIFNGLGRNTREIGLEGKKDLVARLEARPIKWIDIGGGISLKFIEESALPAFVNTDNFVLVREELYPHGYHEHDFIQEHKWMSGTKWMSNLDMVLNAGNWRFVAEGKFGQNWWFEKYPYLWGATAAVYTKHRLAQTVNLWIEPIFKADIITFLSSDLETWRIRQLQLTCGLNLHMGKNTRLMINGDFIFLQGSEADIDAVRREGLWPNEYPGALINRKTLAVQLAFRL